MHGMLSWATAYVLAEWICRLTMLVYVPQRRSPAAARTWLLLIFFQPVLGLALYVLFGRIHYPYRRRHQQAEASRRIRAAQARLRAPAAEPQLPERVAELAAFARRLGEFPATAGNAVELLPGYELPLRRLLEDLDAARHSIDLLYYLFNDDPTGTAVSQALLRARARGVRCRLLLDAAGSRRFLAGAAGALKAAGVEVTPLLPVGLFRRGAARFDLRNHRKIAVVDGIVAYVGSQNIADAVFVPGCPNEELVARVAGPTVQQLLAVLLVDRFLETGALETALGGPPAATGPNVAQVLPSGPGYGRENAQALLVSLLYGARERVTLVTPYFVPDEPFLQALQAARLRGVRVRLILPARSNQRATALAQESHYETLLAAGVEIHCYEGHFLHAKHLTVDGITGMVGSTNLDIRSFALNCEVALLLHGGEAVAELEALQERYLARCHRLDATAWERRPFTQRLAQNCARLADTLL